MPLLLLHLAFTLGVAFALASITVHFRDVAHLTDVLLPLLFWVTPIIYPIGMVPETLRHWVTLSPVALFAVAYRRSSFGACCPNWTIIASMVAWTAATLGLGYLVFRRLSAGMAEDV